MNRDQKALFVSELNKDLNDAASVIVVHYKGLSVEKMTALRREMSQVNATLKVTKNRLTKLAVKNTPYEGLTTYFTGPTAIAYSADPVAAAKAITKFANDNENLVILGGALGADLMDESRVQALAKLPSLDELRGKIVGIISTPATNIARVLQAPAAQIARVISAYASKNQA